MGKHTKIYLQDLFLILASIIGMGFASGKEIQHFFCYNKTLSLICVLIFLLFFNLFFNTIANFRMRNNINNYHDFNKYIFKDYHKFVNICLIIVYSVCASSMLSGIDILSQKIFNLYFPVSSVMLSIITFFIVIGGVSRIQNIFFKFVPALLIIIFINLFVNAFEFTNGFVNIKFVFIDKVYFSSSIISLLLPMIFLGGNFILAISPILSFKSKPKLIRWSASFVFLIFMILAVLVVAYHNNNESMPFLTLSKNLSIVFWSLYLIAILIALISSLIMSTYNTIQLINHKSKLSIIIVVIINQIISFCGFDFIVKYLYTFSGILGLIYCLSVLIIIKRKSKLY